MTELEISMIQGFCSGKGEEGKKSPARPPAPLMRCFTRWILEEGKWTRPLVRDQHTEVRGGQLRDRVVGGLEGGWS